MITFYDKYTQIIVSQTIHAEFSRGLRNEEA